MPQSRFRLAISADQYRSYYAGVAKAVVVRASDGRSVQFPAEHLRPFVTHHGVHGEFILEYDASHRIQALRRVGD